MSDSIHEKQLRRGASENWPDIAGRLIPDGHLLPVRIYFEDTDFTGVVYHASFVRFLERARSDMLRRLGISHEALEKGEFGERLAFAVRHIDITFLKPARIDDIVEVVTTVTKSAGARLVLDQSIRRGAETLVNATVTVAIINAAGRARKLPAEMREKLVALSLG